MLNDAIAIREVTAPGGDARYEVYDGDTGTPLGLFDSYEDARYEVETMKASNRSVWNKERDADPGPE